MSSSAGVAAEQAARTAGKTFFVLPANGLDEDLRHRPRHIPAGQLVRCRSVQDYCTLVLAGDADAADDSAASADAAAAAAATAATASSSVVRLASSTGSGRGRGLVATEALHTDTHLFAERGLVVLQSKNEKVENAIEFAFAVERMADAPMGVLLDLCNAFDEEEIEVIDACGGRARGTAPANAATVLCRAAKQAGWHLLLQRDGVKLQRCVRNVSA